MRKDGVFMLIRRVRSFLFSLILVFSAMLSGCGGPNFEGVWLLDSHNIMTGTPNVHELTIQKNGQAYILNELVYFYEVSQAWVNESEQPLAKADLAYRDLRMPTEAELAADKEAGDNYHPIYNFECRLAKTKSIDNRAATLNDNKLTIDGALGSQTFTYLDGDDTINFNGMVYIRAKGSSLGDRLNELRNRVRAAIGEKVAKEPLKQGQTEGYLPGSKTFSKYMRLGTPKVGDIVFAY